jgi:ATP-dependent protease HslVU (ClpYQ) peptidase subunit
MQAVMIVADAKESLTITGNGDVVEPHDGVIGTCLPATQRTQISALSLFLKHYISALQDAPT